MNRWGDIFCHERAATGQWNERTRISVVKNADELVWIAFVKQPLPVVRIQWDGNIILLVNRDDNHLSNLGVDRAEAAFCEVAVHCFIGGPWLCPKVLFMEACSNDTAHEEVIPGKSPWAIVIPTVGSSRR